MDSWSPFLDLSNAQKASDLNKSSRVFVMKMPGKRSHYAFAHDFEIRYRILAKSCVIRNLAMITTYRRSLIRKLEESNVLHYAALLCSIPRAPKLRAASTVFRRFRKDALVVSVYQRYMPAACDKMSSSLLVVGALLKECLEPSLRTRSSLLVHLLMLRLSDPLSQHIWIHSMLHVSVLQLGRK